FAHRLLNPYVVRTKCEHSPSPLGAPHRCRTPPPICALPVPTCCSRRLESKDFNWLVLIRLRLARVRARGTPPRGTRPGTRRAASRAAGAQTAACIAPQAVARHRPLGGAAPQRNRAGKFAVRKFAVHKFPVQSRKIPCSEGISADAEPALDGCATLCRYSANPRGAPEGAERG